MNMEKKKRKDLVFTDSEVDELYSWIKELCQQEKYQLMFGTPSKMIKAILRGLRVKPELLDTLLKASAKDTQDD